MKAPEYQQHVRETVLHLICDDQLEVCWGSGGGGGGVGVVGLFYAMYKLWCSQISSL